MSRDLGNNGREGVSGSVLHQAARYRSLAALSDDWSHELRGILNVIQINHALLVNVLESRRPEDLALGQRCLSVAIDEVKRVDRLLSLVLDTGTSDRVRTFDAGAMCEQLAQLVAARASKQRVSVSLDIEGSPRDVVGVERMVSAAVLMLMVNALDAMPDQGRLVLGLHGGSTVRLRVADSGPGIPAKVRNRLWTSRRTRNTRRRGIGLRAAHSIVEAHGGWIDCRSEDGGGACFEIGLPAATHEGRG